jgi:hypothetical protein
MLTSLLFKDLVRMYKVQLRNVANSHNVYLLLQNACFRNLKYHLSSTIRTNRVSRTYFR